MYPFSTGTDSKINKPDCYSISMKYGCIKLNDIFTFTKAFSVFTIINIDKMNSSIFYFLRKLKFWRVIYSI